MFKGDSIVREILASGLGHYDSTVNLAREAIDLIKADRIVIKILGRNIESLTMQMTGIIKENQALKERLVQYE